MRKFFLFILIFTMPFAVIAQESPLEISCSDGTIDGAEIGDVYSVECPADCSEGSIWGTDIYTDDSTICTAAAHAGVIFLDKGGVFEIAFVEGQDEYESSEQNGILSSSWGSWDISFTFDFEMDIEIEILEIDWDTEANELEGDSGTVYYVFCPEDGDEDSLWGTEIYTDDSSICTAAVHMGLIDLDDGGEFMVTILDGQDEYEGSEENDIDSSDWGSYGRSFSVDEIDFDMMIEVIEIDWNTRAYDFEGESGTSYYLYCPEDGDEGSLWGTEIYTDDSSICTAAAHMGLIDLDDGGEFVMMILDGQDEYEGSEENDIDSSDWGSYGRSFSVESIDMEMEVLEIEWNTRGYDLEGESGTSYRVSCPEDGELGSLWGTEIYTDDSSICTVAVHMGLADEDDGGEFTVTILDGEDEYEGSEQNDLESSSWGSYSRSISVSK